MATYGNLSLSELIVYNNTSDTSANLQLNSNVSPGDGNFAMSTGLDVTGSTNFNGPCSVNGPCSINGFLNVINGNITFPNANNGIQFSGGTLTFPSSNPLTPSTETNGLGMIWSINGQGETDLIGYGGGGYGTGGISIYGYNDFSGNDNSTRIADFWPTGSNIYTSLTLSNNSDPSYNSTVSLNAFNSNNITDYLSVGGAGILISSTGQYGFATSSGSYPVLSFNSTSDQNFNLNYGLDINNGGLTIFNDDCSFNIYTNTVIGGGINQFMMVEGSGIGFPNNDSQIVFQYSGAPNAVITYSGTNPPGYGGLIINTQLGLMFANNDAQLVYQAPTGVSGAAYLTFSTISNNFYMNYGLNVAGNFNLSNSNYPYPYGISSGSFTVTVSTEGPNCSSPSISLNYGSYIINLYCSWTNTSFTFLAYNYPTTGNATYPPLLSNTSSTQTQFARVTFPTTMALVFTQIYGNSSGVLYNYTIIGGTTF